MPTFNTMNPLKFGLKGIVSVNQAQVDAANGDVNGIINVGPDFGSGVGPIPPTADNFVFMDDNNFVFMDDNNFIFN